MSDWRDNPSVRAVVGPASETHTGVSDCACWACRARAATGDPEAAAADTGIRRAARIRPVFQDVGEESRLNLAGAKLRYRASVERKIRETVLQAAWEQEFLYRPPPLRRPDA